MQVIFTHNGHCALMISDNHTVSSYFARIYMANMVRLGADENLILASIGLSKDVLDEPRARVTPRQLAAIVRANWELADDEFMGLSSKKIKRGMFALLTERLVLCKTLGEVLAETIRFYQLTTEGVGFSLNQHKATTEFVITVERPELDRDNLLVEFLLLVWFRFPSWLLGQPIALGAVQFDFPQPVHSDEYRLMFPCPCEFESGRNALVFNSTWLDKPIMQREDQLQQYLDELPLQWFRKQEFFDPYTAQVIRLLEEGADQGKAVSLESVAISLNMTSRTLRRKLTAEGSRFQKIKDNLRRDRAINLLADKRISISDVASGVGFTEAAAFIRAFKQWTGLSPGAYRKGLHKK
jgi:AraC-like DNA-binding protein